MKTDRRATHLREALAAYSLDTRTINRFAKMTPDELRQILRSPQNPAQVNGLLAVLQILLGLWE